ncbi:MAG: MerR family transcriptional regulator [Pyrinomonadaceae bacterium]|nr:MerR family transcriptional regulator [Pyrinomonadaceae bacterium]
MMTAGALAKKIDVPVYTVRHYTRIGLLKPTRNPGNGYKVYNFSDAVRLRFIMAAKDLGFTLAEISHILDKAKRGSSPCPMVREIVEQRIEENKKKIREMQKLQMKMEKSLDAWTAMENSMPNGDSICHLIESVADVENKIF